MARNYVALPFEYLEEFEDLTYEEVGRLVCALLHYGATGEDKKPEGREGLLWRRVVKQEDRFQESYEETVTFNKERARKAAAARWNKGREDASMLEHAQASFSNAQNAINKTETKTETETETNTETESKLSPSSEGGVYNEPACELSPEAAALREKVEASMRRLRSYRRELEQGEPAYFLSAHP